MKTSNGMKNKLLSGVVLFSLIVLPIVSFAEIEKSNEVRTRNEERVGDGIGTTTQNRESVRNEMENKRGTIKEELEAKKEALKNSVEERRQNALSKIKERIDQFVQNVTERYEAAVSRLETLANRIDSRIAKMEADKINTTKAKELMVEAKLKIEIAKKSVADIASTTSNSSFGTTTAEVKNSFKIMKTQMEKVKENIKEAHAALVEVIKNLKPGQNKTEKENGNASTTSED